MIERPAKLDRGGPARSAHGSAVRRARRKSMAPRPFFICSLDIDIYHRTLCWRANSSKERRNPSAVPMECQWDEVYPHLIGSAWAWAIRRSPLLGHGRFGTGAKRRWPTANGQRQIAPPWAALRRSGRGQSANPVSNLPLTKCTSCAKLPYGRRSRNS